MRVFPDEAGMIFRQSGSATDKASSDCPTQRVYSRSEYSLFINIYTCIFIELRKPFNNLDEMPVHTWLSRL